MASELFSSLALLLLTAAAAMAQISSLEGYVKDAAGKPVINAVILFQRQDVSRGYQAKTDKRGSYFYQGLPLGFYAVKVVVDGKEVAGVGGILTQPGGPLEVSFNLGATPQGQEAQIKSALKKSGAEWSYVKILAVQPATAEPAVLSAPGPAAAPTQPAAPTTAVPTTTTPPPGAAEYKAGHEALAARKFPEAIALLKRAAALDTGNAFRIYYNLGTVLTNAGELDQALEAFRQAVAAAPGDPGNAESYYQLGVSLVGRAKVTPDGKLVPAEGTLEALQTYLHLAPNGPNAQAARDLAASMGGKK